MNFRWKRNEAIPKPRAEDEGRISPKSRVKEKSHKIIKNSKPRAKEDQSINSWKIPNLMRKRDGTSNPNYFEFRAKENSSCKFIKDFKHRLEKGQNIRYYLHLYGTLCFIFSFLDLVKKKKNRPVFSRKWFPNKLVYLSLLHICF